MNDGSDISCMEFILAHYHATIVLIIFMFTPYSANLRSSAAGIMKLSTDDRIVTYICFKRILPHSWIFSPGENYCQVRHLISLVKILSANFFSCVKDCIVDMATFTALAKNPSNITTIQR